MAWTFYNASGEQMIEDGAMSIANNTNNRVVTATGADPASLNGEANLTFDGTDLTVGTGNVIMATSGKGIDFAAKTTDGTSATAEILDDYEYGTFVPTSASSTYTTQVGRYVKVGRMVHFSAQLEVNDHGGSASARVSGLPFTSANVTSHVTSISVSYFSGLATNVLWIGGYVETNAATIQFPNLTSAGTVVTSAAATIWDDAARVNFSGVYEAAT